MQLPRLETTRGGVVGTLLVGALVGSCLTALTFTLTAPAAGSRIWFAGAVTRNFLEVPFAMAASGGKVPLIFDMDANYDDSLALAFLANHPTLDLKAVTVCANGFATAHGGPVNMQKLLGLLGRPDIPVSVGEFTGLSPITSFPPAWQIEIDQFYESQDLPEPETPLSMFSSPQLIAKLLKESPVKMAVLVTGSATNLAIALRKEPELINYISVLYLMGSNYGGESNNVYNFQMTFAGAYGSCVENVGASSPVFTSGSYPFNVTRMGYGKGQEGAMATMRPGCRGLNMDEAGETEWNVFLDAVAWHTVTRAVAEAASPPELYAYTSKATESMAITMEDFKAGTAVEGIKPELASFMMDLAAAFLAAGEAKWWDASTVVSLGEIIAGNKMGLCTKWAHSTGFMVSQTWKEKVLGNPSTTITRGLVGSRTGYSFPAKATSRGVGKLPYGSIVDRRSIREHALPVARARFTATCLRSRPGLGPEADFCMEGDHLLMQDVYWQTLAGNPPPSQTTIDEKYYKLGPGR